MDEQCHTAIEVLAWAVLEGIKGEGIEEDGEITEENGERMAAGKVSHSLGFIEFEVFFLGQCREGAHFGDRHLGVVLMVKIVRPFPDARRSKNVNSEDGEDGICQF